MAKRARKPSTIDPKWVRTASDEHAVREGCTFDLSAAQRVEEFLRRFVRHSKGRWAGQPLVLLDWQRDELVYPLFGWKRPDGTRRFRRAYVEVPKKSGKSTLAAGIGISLLVADGEPGAEVYSAATDREQASITHGEAIRMVTASPELSQRLTINRSTKNIAFEGTQSWYRALAAEANSVEGKNIHGLIIDELHAWEHQREFFDALRYGGAARKQPLTLMITTAGVYDPQSVGWSEHEYARQVLAGTLIDTSYFARIWAADPADDWTKPATWRKANPSMGTTIDEAEMAEACAEARAKPRLENSFKRYRLNLWTQQVDRWLPMEVWAANGGAVDEAELAGRPCWGGMDLATTTDIAAVVLVFPPDGEQPIVETGSDSGTVVVEGVGDGGPSPQTGQVDTADCYRVVCRFFVPENQQREHERRNRESYELWARQGWLVRTPGEVTDYTYIREEIISLAKQFDLREMAYDKWNAQILANELTEAGVTMIEHRQGFVSFNEPSKSLERLLLMRRIRHGDNPVLTWMAGNVAVETDAAGNIKPSKSKSTQKIDGIVALIMALGRSRHGGGGGRSVYENRTEGLVWI